MRSGVKLIDGEVAGKASESVLARVSRFLRRRMPYIAIAATVCFVLWLILSNFDSFQVSDLGDLFSLFTFLLVWFTILYYTARAFRWTKRHLLWRVRRRLIITYLFIGLTPIVLCTVLGLVAWAGLAPQAMARLVSVQTNATETQTLANARLAANDLANLPANLNDVALQTWIDGRAASLQATLPGAQIAVWRSSASETATNSRTANNVNVNDAIASNVSASNVSASNSTTNERDTSQFFAKRAALVSRINYEESMRGLPGETVQNGDPPPAWLTQSLLQKNEWGGLSYTMPPETNDQQNEVFRYAIASFRAAVRAESDMRRVVVLVTVPMNRQLIKQFSDSTGLRVRPFFIRPRTGENVDIQINVGGDNNITATSDKESQQQKDQKSRRQQRARQVFERDQFGEPMPSGFSRNGMFTYPVFVGATNWTDGETDQKWVFSTDLSWGIMANRILGDQTTGEVWRVILIVLGITFLILEILAVLTAGWMTRAITGTVHKLYQATARVKSGDFSHRIKVRSHDQLGELAGAFNEMSADIEELLRERVKSVKLQREVEIAAEVQAQLFPRETPQLETIEIAGECRAARGVAGDYYDYLQITPALYVLALGDVSGKGISASLVMSNLQATLRAQTLIIGERMRNLETHNRELKQFAQASGGIAALAETTVKTGETDLLDTRRDATALSTSVVSEMTSNVNKQLCRTTDSNRFATLFVTLYDDQTRTLRYTNAGHNDAVLVRADSNAIELLKSGGLMVGAFDFAAYEEVNISLRPGDLLLIFSDGISEATNAEGEEYGEERVAKFAQTNRYLSATEFLHELFEVIDEWSAGQERGDDQTLVVIKAREDDIETAETRTSVSAS